MFKTQVTINRTAHWSLRQSGRGGGIHRLVPRVSAWELADRRCRLLERMKPNSIFLLPCADPPAMTNDIPFPFRQNSLFYHLFQLDSPLVPSLSPPSSLVADVPSLSMAVFLRSGEGQALQTVLFLPEDSGADDDKKWNQHEVYGAVARDCLSSSHPREHLDIRGNSILQIAQFLSSEVYALTKSKIKTELHSSMTEKELTPSLLKSITPLPLFYLHYPQSLTFGPQRFRLPWTALTSSDTPTKGTILLNHPFEALLVLLLSFQVSVLCPDRVLRGGASSSTVIKRLDCIQNRYDCIQSFGHYSSRVVRSAQEVRNALLPELTFSFRDDGEPMRDADHTPSEAALLTSVIHASDSLENEYKYIKSPSQLLQHLVSAEYTRKGFERIREQCAHTYSEVEVAGALEEARLTLQRKAPSVVVRQAYIPVVAASQNSRLIHYTSNSHQHTPGEALRPLLRVDAGYEVGYTPTDCTRTFPFGQRTFDPIHEALYTLLLQLQRKLLLSIREDTTVSELSTLHITETQQLLERLLELDGQAGEAPPSLQTVRAYYCAHSVGHFFGMDIHETFPAGPRQSVLAAGSMHTVEPGVYLHPTPHEKKEEEECTFLFRHPQLQNIGIQIEDDVLVLPSKGSSSGPWGREAYVRATLQLYRQLEEEEEGSASLGTKEVDSLAPLAASLLFDQRCALEGISVAREKQEEDKRDVQESVSRGSFPDCDWFPFDIIVTTARIPKDLEWLQSSSLLN